jgi:hypothetical protein
MGEPALGQGIPQNRQTQQYAIIHTGDSAFSILID